MALDIEQHPRDWKRRISSVESCLSTGSPAVKKLHKSYKNWQKLGPDVTEEYSEAVDALFDSWHEATKEIDKNNERLEDHKKWWFSVRLSLAAITLSTVSIAVSTFFQYENLKINRERLDIQVKRKATTSETAKPTASAVSMSHPTTTHKKSMQPTAKTSLN